MINRLFKALFRLKGWKADPGAIAGVKQSIVIAAPHTSNWDAVFALAAFDVIGLPVRLAWKKEWFRFGLRRLLRNLGGVPIDRSPKGPGENRVSTVAAMAELFKNHEVLHLVISPEGTRSLCPKWKTGFWHTAKLANVPILFGYLDYEKKIAGISKMIHPSDDFEADMRIVMEFYKNIIPRYPKKFSLDIRYI